MTATSRIRFCWLALLFPLLSPTLLLAAETERPAHPPQPPKEAYTACSNLIEQDPCTITTPNNQVIEGVCVPVKNNKQETALACRPNHMPPPPEGIAPPPGDAPPEDESAEQ